MFAWELWNEVNAVRGGDYLAWTEAMLAELHKRFPRNLCVQSLGSFDAARARALGVRVVTFTRAVGFEASGRRIGYGEIAAFAAKRLCSCMAGPGER